MAWIYLAIGVLGEIAWVLTLKTTEGYSRLGPSVVNLTLAVLNIVVLSQAFKTLPTAAAYAIWTGASAVGIAVLAVVIYGEPMTAPKILCMALVIAGVMGLKMMSV